MTLRFYKYQGTGNDFVVLDNRNGALSLTRAQIAFLCHRRFGVGADGLMVLNSHPGYDFQMVYYNADAADSSMCGNGGRCLVKFAADAGIKKEAYRFLAVDGEHTARIEPNGEVALKMNDVKQVDRNAERSVLDTGSPHYVTAAENVMALDVIAEGRAIRNSEEFREKGINVNFVQADGANNGIIVRTYERGVEDETFSCGTGVTAAALVHATTDGRNRMNVQTKGGKLAVEFNKTENGFQDIWLIGPAVKVFEGEIEV